MWFLIGLTGGTGILAVVFRMTEQPRQVTVEDDWLDPPVIHLGDR